jgi:hypothetical protein
MRSFRPSWALEASGYRVTWEGDVISATSEDSRFVAADPTGFQQRIRG